MFPVTGKGGGTFRSVNSVQHAASPQSAKPTSGGVTPRSAHAATAVSHNRLSPHVSHASSYEWSSVLPSPVANGHGLPMSTQREAELMQQLQYTQDVLKKYKHYVETRIMDQLRQAQRTVEVLHLDCDRLRKEKDALLGNVSATATELEAKKQLTATVGEQHAKELQRVVETHAEQVAALERRHAAEMASLRKTLEEHQAAEAQRQSLQSIIAKRDDEIRKLRVALADFSSKQTSAHGEAAAYSEIQSEIHEAAAIIDDFFRTVSLATSEQLHLADAGEALVSDGSPPSRGGVRQSGGTALPAVLPSMDDFRRMVSSESGGGGGGGASSSKAPSGPSSSVVLDARALRHMIEHSQRTVVVLLKSVLEEHSRVAERSEAAERALSQERDLTRSRLAEIEEDRKTEREHYKRLLEESRLKSVVANTSTAQLLQHAGSAQVPHGLLGGSLDVTSMMLSSGGSSSPGEPQRKLRRSMPVGVQTALDVALFTPPQGSANLTGTQAYHRVLVELTRLQDENNELRKSVQLLDAQRRRFLGFVNGEEISQHVSAVLSGSLADALW